MLDIEASPGDPRLEAGAAKLRAGEPARARALLEAALPEVDADGSLDARMAGHALLGRACVVLRDARCAAKQFEIVRAHWKDPAAGMKTLAARGASEQDTAARARRALSAAGEALFHAAELKRASAEAERFPAYRGNGSKEDVLKHMNTKVRSWIRARREKIEEAEKAYAAITALQPEPPPRWVIAGASRVGDLWDTFTVSFRASPIPAAWKAHGPVPGSPDLTWDDVRANYYAALDEASEPMKTTARAAFTACWSLAQKHKLEDPFSRRCQAWLEKDAPLAARGPLSAPP